MNPNVWDDQRRLQASAADREWLARKAELREVAASAEWPLATLILPVMQTRNLSRRALARAAGTSRENVERVLRGPWVPWERTLLPIAAALELDMADVRRARRECRELVGPRPPGGLPKAILRREGREGLRRRARNNKKLRAQRRITHAERVAMGQRGAPARRAYWKSATAADRQRWSAQHLKARPSGRFGLCRLCGKLTYTRDKRPQSRGELHRVCFERWKADSADYADWLGHGGRGPQPLPAYPRGRRLNSEELAWYFEASIRYMHIKRSAGDGVTVQALALELGLGGKPHTAAIELLKRVDRLTSLLPDDSVCNADLRRKVRVLRSDSAVGN